MSNDFISTKKSKRNKNKNLIISPKSIDDYLSEISTIKRQLVNTPLTNTLFDICSKCIDSSTIKYIQCLALGSPASNDLINRPAKYQTGLLLLLADHFNINPTDIHVWDPIFTEDDKNLLNKLNIHHIDDDLLKMNQSNTLYYLPHAPVSVINTVVSLAEKNPGLRMIGNPLYDYEVRIYRAEVKEQKELVKIIENKSWKSHVIDDKLSGGEVYSTAFSSMAVQYQREEDGEEKEDTEKELVAEKEKKDEI